MNIFNIQKILKFFRANFDLKKPIKKDVIIFDKVGSEIIQSYLKNEAIILEVRLEKINIFILLKTFFNFKFNKSILQNYIENFINYVDPKIIITHIDNNEFFFKLKKIFPKVKFIAIQNGTGLANIPEKQLDLKNWYVDYFFVYSNSYKLIYEKFVKGKIINIGSLINNQKKITINNNTEKQIVYISQYRKRGVDTKKFYKFANKYFSWEDFRFAERKVIEFLSKYCDKNKIKLCIAGVYNDKINQEKIFYNDLISNVSENIVWEFRPRINKWDSYNLIDSAQLVVFVDSALGYQSLARKNKTVSFSIRSQYLSNPQLKFGWPSKFDDDGPFWSNFFEETKLEKILDTIIYLSKIDWNNLLEKYENKLLNYDYDNSKFKKIMQEIR